MLVPTQPGRTTLRVYVRLAVVAAALAFIVVVLGAYVRLNDAGLGCPDWPGCYGSIVVPDSAAAVRAADRDFPGRPVDAAKAWREMTHRYAAGTLGLLILALAVLAWRRRRMPGQLVGLPLFLVGLVVVQALLGMWTVTLLLKPLVVTAHLLLGMTTLALLWWLALRQGSLFSSFGALEPAASAGTLRRWLVLGLVILYVQLFLGAWTSSNYAALACPGFPRCLGQWWPPMDFHDAFLSWHAIGIDYEGGVLSAAARAAIQMTHRLGALVTFLYIGVLGLVVLRRWRARAVGVAAAVMLLLLVSQVCLGIANVEFARPLAVAVAHNANAALLLLSVVTLLHLLRAPRVAL